MDERQDKPWHPESAKRRNRAAILAATTWRRRPAGRHHRQVVVASSAPRSLSLAASKCRARALRRTT
jgi:hypothetical protein